MYNESMYYPYMNYHQQFERQIPGLPGSQFPGPSGIPGPSGPLGLGVEPSGVPEGIQIPGLPGHLALPGHPDLPGPQSLQAPTAPPPSFIPQQADASTFAVNPGAISLCLFRNTFIWLSNGEGFWYYPIFIGSRSVAGFRWNGRFWTVFSIDTRQIMSFTCF